MPPATSTTQRLRLRSHRGHRHHFGFGTGLTSGARQKNSYHNGRDEPIDSDYIEPDATNQPQLNEPTPLKTGLGYLKHREYQRAAKTLLQAVLAEPNAGIPKLALGDALFAGGDYDYAADAIRRGIDRIGDVEEALTDRKDYFKGPAELNRLMYKLRRSLKEDSQNSDSHFLLGYYEYVAGHAKAANQSFQRALEIDSDDLHAARLGDLASEHS